MSYYLGLEVGKRRILAMAVDSEGTILASASTVVSTLNQQCLTEHTLMDLLNKAFEVINIVISSFRTKPQAIGISTECDSPLAWNRLTLSPIVIDEAAKSRHFKSLERAHQNPKSEDTTETLIARSPIEDPLALQYSYIASQIAHDTNIAVGSLNSWLLATLTQNSTSLMDHSEASTTFLFNINTSQFDPLLCKDLQVEPALLPQLSSSSSYFGEVSHPGIESLRGVPVLALLGYEQASALGAGCASTGETIVSLESDISVLSNSGSRPSVATPTLSTVILWSLENRKLTYGLKALAPSLGSSLESMMTTFALASDLHALETLAKTARSSDQVTFVSQFSRGEPKSLRKQQTAFLGGLDLSTNKNQIARALFESLANVVTCAISDIQKLGSFSVPSLRLRGYLSEIDLLNQLVADRTDLVCKKYSHSAAYGVALLSARDSKHSDIGGFQQNNSEMITFVPSSNRRGAKSKLDRWNNYVEKASHN